MGFPEFLIIHESIFISKAGMKKVNDTSNRVVIELSSTLQFASIP
jgi:hypothetical protein